VQSSTPDRRANLLLPVLITLFISAIVFGLGGYYFGKASRTENQALIQEKNDQGQNLPSPTPNSSPPTSEIQSDLLTYTSTKALYSFDYYSEWPLVNVPTSLGCEVCVEDVVFTPKYDQNSSENTIAVILVFKEDRIKTLDDYVNILVKGDSSKVDMRNTFVGSEKAVSYKLSGGIPPLPVIEYAVVKNGYYYIIRLNDSIETNKNKDRNLKLFDKMLTTFKFE
jgi:hypothetical protein